MNPKSLSVAVLFIIYNRLETTQKVFESLAKAKPSKLYIASDGPNSNKFEDEKKVKSVRKFVYESINWSCDVKTLFQESNIGCALNVKTSIDWFFDNEEYGIIIEDDVFPSHSFYWYCEELLKKYENDYRIGMISGNNHINFNNINESYLFSKHKGIWGWATWKRAWDNMDFDMSWLVSPYKNDIIKNMGHGYRSYVHWKNAINHIKNQIVDTWGWKWYFSLAAYNQLCIFPKYNLVANMGFGDNATHTHSSVKKEYIQVQDIELPLKHPKYVLPNQEHDHLFEKKKMKYAYVKRLIPPKYYKTLRRIVPI